MKIIHIIVRDRKKVDTTLIGSNARTHFFKMPWVHFGNLPKQNNNNNNRSNNNRNNDDDRNHPKGPQQQHQQQPLSRVTSDISIGPETNPAAISHGIEIAGMIYTGIVKPSVNYNVN